MPWGIPDGGTSSNAHRIVINSSFLVAYSQGHTFFLEEDSLFTLPDRDTLQRQRLPSGGYNNHFAATRQDLYMQERGRVLRFEAGTRTWAVLDSTLGEASQIIANGDYLYVKAGRGSGGPATGA